MAFTSANCPISQCSIVISNASRDRPFQVSLKMDLWNGKVAVVTGASAGIGAAICKDLCKQGVIVVGMARRLDRMEALKHEIEEEKQSSRFVPVQCDVTKEDEVETAFAYVISKLGGVDILINNAGVAKIAGILDDEDNLDRMKTVIDTNVMALVSCTKKAFKSMADRDVPGYIINISSLAGHNVLLAPGVKPRTNLYHSSKHAVKALTQVIRHELNFLKRNKIRISNVSPGFVRTDIFNASGSQINPQWKMLEPEDISDTVLYLLATNPRVQVEDVILRATGG